MAKQFCEGESTQENFCILSGTTPAKNEGLYSNLPSGWNNNNSIVISFNIFEPNDRYNVVQYPEWYSVAVTGNQLLVWTRSSADNAAVGQSYKAVIYKYA